MAQDYIMRLVQQIAAMLAAIIAKRRRGEIAEARQEIDAACLQTVGFTLETVKRMPPDTVAQHLAASGGNRFPRAVMLAELLIQDGEIHEAQNGSQPALVSHLHAFCLLSDSVEVLSPEEQAIYRPKLAMLAEKLENLPANPYVAERLHAYRISQDAEPSTATNPPEADH
jgi:hypothetical protein